MDLSMGKNPPVNVESIDMDFSFHSSMIMWAFIKSILLLLLTLILKYSVLCLILKYIVCLLF